MKYGLILWMIICCTSCSQKSIELGIVRHSSDLLHCEKVFGYSIKRLREKNEILLQTGYVDTTTETKPFETAIINYKQNEIVMVLNRRTENQNMVTESYSNDTFNIRLTYSKETIHQSSIYKGTFVIQLNHLESTYSVEGSSCF
jgi:hypothetical protein